MTSPDDASGAATAPDAAGLLAALPCPVWAYDAAGRLSFANPAAYAAAGITPAQFPLGRSRAEALRLLAYRGLLGGGDPEARVRQHLEVDRGQPRRRSLRLPDGRTLESLSVPLPGGGYLAVLLDVTPHAQALDAAQAETARLAEVLSRLHGGVAVWDAEHRLALHNPAYEVLLGLPRGHSRPGDTLAEVLRRIAGRDGHANADAEAAIAADLAVDRSRPHTSLRERQGGQVVRLDSQPMADGGWLLEVDDVTALKRAEDEARHRAAQLDAVLAALPAGVMVVGPDLRVRLFNESCQRMFAPTELRVGEDRADLARRRAEEGEYGPGERAALAAANLTPLDRPSLRHRTRPDGTTLEVRAAPLPDGGYVQVLTDITDLHRMRAAASERAKVLQTALDNMRHGILLVGPDRRVVAANQLAMRYTGLGPEVMCPGTSMQALREAQLASGELGDGDVTRSWISRADSIGRDQEIRYTRRRPDGTIIEVASNPTPDGGFVITYTDITARAEAEAASREQATTLHGLLENLRLGVTLFGPDRRVRAVNSLAATLAGLPPASVRPGVSLAQLVAWQDAGTTTGDAELGAVLSAEVVNQDRSQPQRHLRPTADGRLLEVRSDPMPDGGFVVTHYDITALARAEAEAERRAALLQATLDHLRHGVAMFGPDQRLETFNGLAAELIAPAGGLARGMTQEAVLRALAAQGYFDTMPEPETELARLLAADRRLPLRAERRLRDGRVFEVGSDPTPDGGFIITFVDITARARAEAEARARAAAMEATLAHMRHGIALYDAGRRLVASNPLYEELSGLPAGTLAPGRSFEELLAQQAAHGAFGPEPGASAVVAELASLDRSQPVRYLRERSDGRVVEIKSDPTPDGGFIISATDVTARVIAERAAEERAAALQAMLDNIQHGIALYGPDRRLRAANRLASPVVGMPPLTEHIGESFDALVERQLRAGNFGPGRTGEAARQWVLGLDRRQPHRYVRHLADGRIVAVNSAPTPDGGFVITHSDITALETARAEAERRAALLQAMLDNVQHGIGVYDSAGRLVLANALAEDLCGLPPGSMRPGVTQAELMRLQLAHGGFGDGPEAEGYLRDGLARNWREPIRFQRRDRRGRMIDVTANPMPDGGYVLGWSDITATVQAQAEAAERAVMLQAMLASMRHGIALFDRHRRLRTVNPLAARLAGLPEDEARLGSTLEELVQRQLAVGAVTTAHAAEVLTFDRRRSFDYLRQGRDGSMIEVSSDPTPDGGFVLTFSDVTQLLRAEAEAQHRAGIQQVMLDSMRHGIALFDRDHRLVTFNALVQRYSGLSEAIIHPGASFADITRAQVDAGLLPPEEAERSLAWDRRQPMRVLRRGAGGMLLEASSDPTPDGGFVVTLSDVSPVARAEEAARARAELLQMVMDSMRHGIVRYDRDRRLVAVNRLALQLHGLEGEEERLIGRREPDIARELYARGELDERDLRASLDADITSHRRHLRTRRNGQVVLFTATPTPDGGYVVTVSDITDLTQAETAARERAAILQVMLDNIRHGICYYGPDRRVIAANKLAAGLGGHRDVTLAPGTTIDELIEDQLASGAVPPGQEAVAELARRMDRSKPSQYIRRNGEGKVIEITSDPTPNGGFVVTSTDVTRLAEAEAVAQQRAQVLGIMLDNIRQGIVLFGADRRLITANPRVRQMLGVDDHAVEPGQHLHEYIRRLAHRGVYGSDAEALARAEATIGRFDPAQPNRHVRAGPGGEVIEVVSDPTPDGGFVLTYTDVTEDRRIRTELEAAREAAEAANKAKSRFLATMTHELRTPLNAVIGFSEALQTAPDKERAAEYLASIHEAGRHLLSLIDDILDVTRAETTGFQVAVSQVDPTPLCESVVRVMRAAAAASGVTLELNLAAPLPPVRADQVRLRQVLLNLLSNAVKFTPAQGSVTLQSWRDAEGGLVLAVRDTGIGLKPEEVPRAFEAFTQLDSSLSRRFPGSGLGLYLSRALAEAQGATLTLHAAEGGGTLAVLRFPPDRVVQPGQPDPLFAP